VRPHARRKTATSPLRLVLDAECLDRPSHGRIDLDRGRTLLRGEDVPDLADLAGEHDALALALQVVAPVIASARSLASSVGSRAATHVSR
jgi:hypothetical protein